MKNNKPSHKPLRFIQIPAINLVASPAAPALSQLVFPPLPAMFSCFWDSFPILLFFLLLKFWCTPTQNKHSKFTDNAPLPFTFFVVYNLISPPSSHHTPSSQVLQEKLHMLSYLTIFFLCHVCVLLLFYVMWFMFVFYSFILSYSIFFALFLFVLICFYLFICFKSK